MAFGISVAIAGLLVFLFLGRVQAEEGFLPWAKYVRPRFRIRQLRYGPYGVDRKYGPKWFAVGEHDNPVGEEGCWFRREWSSFDDAKRWIDDQMIVYEKRLAKKRIPKVLWSDDQA